eukprot:2441244-Pyramimonas_sp.AAC.1
MDVVFDGSDQDDGSEPSVIGDQRLGNRRPRQPKMIAPSRFCLIVASGSGLWQNVFPRGHLSDAVPEGGQVAGAVEYK